MNAEFVHLAMQHTSCAHLIYLISSLSSVPILFHSFFFITAAFAYIRQLPTRDIFPIIFNRTYHLFLVSSLLPLVIRSTITMWMTHHFPTPHFSDPMVLEGMRLLAFCSPCPFHFFVSPNTFHSPSLLFFHLRRQHRRVARPIAPQSIVRSWVDGMSCSETPIRVLHFSVLITNGWTLPGVWSTTTDLSARYNWEGLCQVLGGFLFFSALAGFSSSFGLRGQGHTEGDMHGKDQARARCFRPVAYLE